MHSLVGVDLLLLHRSYLLLHQLVDHLVFRDRINYDHLCLVSALGNDELTHGGQ